jgi:hypothetical protein
MIAGRRSDVAPTMATRNSTVDMTVKWLLNPRNLIESTHGAFMKLSAEVPLSNGHRFLVMEVEHTKRFLGLSRHFTALSVVALLVAIVVVTSLLRYDLSN